MVEEKLKTQGFQLSKEGFSLESDLHKLLALIHKLEWEDRAGSIIFLDLARQMIQTGNARKEILVADVELQRLAKP